MNPDDIQLNQSPDSELTHDDLASIAVDPAQAPPVTPVEDNSPIAALLVFAALVAAAGKKIQMFMQASHETRMEEKRIAALETQAVLEDQEEQRANLRADLQEAEAQEAAQKAALTDEIIISMKTIADKTNANGESIADMAKRMKALENWRRQTVKASRAT